MITSIAEGGFVDFTLGAEPGTGALVVYQPYHLPHLEAPITVARAALFGDAAVAPQGAPVCEVATLAKRDLPAGTMLDGIGGFDCDGAIDNADTTQRANLLPIGLAACRLLRDVQADSPITRADVEPPGGRLVDRLYAEQLSYFSSATH